MNSIDETQETNFVLSKDLTRKLFKSDFSGFSGSLKYVLWKVSSILYYPEEHRLFPFQRTPLSEMRKAMGNNVTTIIRIYAEREVKKGNRTTTLPLDFLPEDEYPIQNNLLQRVYTEIYNYIKDLNGKRLKRIGKLEINSEGNICISEIPSHSKVPNLDDLDEEDWHSTPSPNLY